MVGKQKQSFLDVKQDNTFYTSQVQPYNASKSKYEEMFYKTLKHNNTKVYYHNDEYHQRNKSMRNKVKPNGALLAFNQNSKFKSDKRLKSELFNHSLIYQF